MSSQRTTTRATVSIAPSIWLTLALIGHVQDALHVIVVTEWRSGDVGADDAVSVIPQVLAFGSWEAMFDFETGRDNTGTRWRPSATMSFDDYRPDWPVRDGESWR